MKLFEGFIIHSVVGKQVKRFGGEVCDKGGVGLFHVMGPTHNRANLQWNKFTNKPTKYIS